MNGSEFHWRGVKRAKRLSAWGPRLMLAEARMREQILLWHRVSY